METTSPTANSTLKKSSYHPSGASGSGIGRTKVGRYELGRTLGEGTFAKVKFARNTETGENVAIKILDKEKVLKHKMISQVMASKTKIYIVLEFVTGGELFDKIASKGRLKEDEARKYFQQLINAVDYCHSRGPENLLLDANGVLKVSDFGLSALPQQVREDGLLHTTCGTPNYVAPEVINNKGYDGAKADLWSCGVILFVLMAGYLPFEESSLVALYKKVPVMLTPFILVGVKQRITIAEVIENEWFKKGYKPPTFEQADVSLDDVDAIFNESGDSPNLVVERREERPVFLNAFELISKSQGLNLSSLFEKQMGLVKRETRFTSKRPASEIISKIEEAAVPLGFDVKKNNYKLKLQGEKTGRKGHLSVSTEVFEVAPSLCMVELRKAGGDTLEFHKMLDAWMRVWDIYLADVFYKNLATGLKDIVWKTGDEAKEDANDGKALSVNPSLHSASLHSIHSIISFLQSKGIHQKDMGRIFGMCPQILTSNIKSDLIPVFNFLFHDLRVPETNFRSVINKCPRLLACSVRDQLKPALFYLQRLGFRDLKALAYQDPILLVSSVENTLIPKLDYLGELGFSRNDTVGMVLRCPTLFTFSIENNFKPKFEYFDKEMGGRLEELKEFPGYFAFSLEKRIKPRHMEVVQSGVKVPLPLMLKSTDEEFRELIRRGGR
ncbi:hypothetical protein RHSIM_Rhsim13G0117100 [Rhododendron simsii]|uniref:non-specific serine/threonine protein kinase n=1 Tax=Rhododendron simsii TaxID=118357 RepID=A0A834G0A4_RHOSS|nr:hypothetical protein RHSIM_Rhsim13G0117100 [Rhododendron simsii]